MPSINIYNNDKTSSNSFNPTENIVYIPGYVGEGYEFDKPILCRTLSDFHKEFGDSPYRIKSSDIVNFNSITIDTTTSYSFINNGSEDHEFYTEGDYEKSYQMAEILIGKGIPVLFENIDARNDNKFDITNLYKKMLANGSIFDKLSDKGAYEIKFITSGAYPVFEFGYTDNSNKNVYPLVAAMIKAAAERGDSIALIDYLRNDGRSLTDTDTPSLYSSLNSYLNSNPLIVEKKVLNSNVPEGVTTETEDAYTYGSMFMPYANYTINNNNYTFPASFGYLLALSESLKSGNPDYFAIAGVNRGNLGKYITGLTQPITNAVANAYQNKGTTANKKASINCITDIQPDGYTIWGNRTLKLNNGSLQALSLLNLRVLTNDVNKVTHTVCQRYTFENNSDVLWVNFKSNISPTLDKMKSNNAIENYSISKVSTNLRATLGANIRLIPIDPVEDWYVTVDLTNADNSSI